MSSGNGGTGLAFQPLPPGTPNKRLKLSAPTGAGYRCRLGRRACHKEVVDFTRCGGLRRSLSAGR